MPDEKFVKRGVGLWVFEKVEAGVSFSKPHPALA